MKRLETLRQKMENAFVDGNPEALRLGHDADKLVIKGHSAMLHQDGTIHIIGGGHNVCRTNEERHRKSI